MAFAITRFIHPIESSITLSAHFDFVLDNPRTAEEVALTKAFIRKTFTNDEGEKVSKVFAAYQLCCSLVKAGYGV